MASVLSEGNEYSKEGKSGTNGKSGITKLSEVALPISDWFSKTEIENGVIGVDKSVTLGDSGGGNGVRGANVEGGKERLIETGGPI